MAIAHADVTVTRNDQVIFSQEAWDVAVLFIPEDGTHQIHGSDSLGGTVGEIFSGLMPDDVLQILIRAVSGG